ncbi:hypothetical protein DMN91_008311 [Ooceraea biroi]|uniref:Uncharacterized protein n=1 Tax=Ooceraea biroi TaxID=2015173 RepID=A0A3L8DH38_OOCBI|nr:hypothetical protein DMN91_008311 [Ooceraea biroi]
MGKIVNAHTHEAKKHGSVLAISVEKMQIHVKLLEDSNAALHLRNQDLIAENKSLARRCLKAIVRRLEEDAIKIEKLREESSLLQDEFRNERVKLADALVKQTVRTIIIYRTLRKYLENIIERFQENDNVCLEEKCTSTDIVSKVDRELQIWEACKNCEEELEGCQGELTVTITKSELEVLERDMRTLRDAIIAREEAWDKAMERERNCQQHLARLTAETITARHLCEARQDELCAVTEALTEKESELRATQKEVLYLSKLVSKLHGYQK